MLELLDKAWAPAREAGVLGPQSASEFNEHAKGFVVDDWRTDEPLHLIDIGTGAGVPGILLALELPTSRWTIIDSNKRRCEFAEKAVKVLGLGHRVSVDHVRAGQLSHSSAGREQYDGATSRLFGSVAELAECGLPLLRIGAVLTVSVSDVTERQWRRADLMSTAGCQVMSSWSTAQGSFLAVKRLAPTPDRLPRRAAARRRSPLF